MTTPPVYARGSLRRIRADHDLKSLNANKPRVQIYETSSLARPKSVPYSRSNLSKNINNTINEDEEADDIETKSEPRSDINVLSNSDDIGIDKFGFLLTGDEQKAKILEMNSNEYKSQIRKNNDRLIKWLEMLKHWDLYTTTKSNKLKSRIRKGIPNALRAKVWTQILNLEEPTSEQKEYYRKFSIVAPAEKARRSIENDLDRTFPTHILFSKFSSTKRGIDSLRHVLYAYANHDPEVGYTQGMGFIAALLLMLMTEDNAFWSLVTLLDTKGIFGMRGLYMEGLPTLHLRYFQLTTLIERFLPKVYEHLMSFNVSVEMYAAKWFITIFCYQFPFEVVYRIWDIYLYEGVKMVFRIALGILKCHEVEILEIEDFETMVKYMQSLHLQLDHDIDEFFKTCFDLPLKREHLTQIEEMYAKKTLAKKRNMRRARSAGGLARPNPSLINRTGNSQSVSSDVIKKSNSDYAIGMSVAKKTRDDFNLPATSSSLPAEQMLGRTDLADFAHNYNNQRTLQQSETGNSNFNAKDEKDKANPMSDEESVSSSLQEDSDSSLVRQSNGSVPFKNNVRNIQTLVRNKSK